MSDKAFLVESSRRVPKSAHDQAEKMDKDLLTQMYQDCLTDVRQATRNVAQSRLNGIVVVMRVEQWVEPEGWDKPDFPMADWGGRSHAGPTPEPGVGS